MGQGHAGGDAGGGDVRDGNFFTDSRNIFPHIVDFFLILAYNNDVVQNRIKCLLLLDMQLKEGRVQMFVAPRYATEKWPGSNFMGSCSSE